MAEGSLVAYYRVSTAKQGQSGLGLPAYWSLSFLTRLLDSGVDVRFCDAPKIEGPTGARGSGVRAAAKAKSCSRASIPNGRRQQTMHASHARSRSCHLVNHVI